MLRSDFNIELSKLREVSPLMSRLMTHLSDEMRAMKRENESLRREVSRLTRMFNVSLAVGKGSTLTDLTNTSPGAAASTMSAIQMRTIPHRHQQRTLLHALAREGARSGSSSHHGNHSHGNHNIADDITSATVSNVSCIAHESIVPDSVIMEQVPSDQPDDADEPTFPSMSPIVRKKKAVRDRLQLLRDTNNRNNNSDRIRPTPGFSQLPPVEPNFDLSRANEDEVIQSSLSQSQQGRVDLDMCVDVQLPTQSQRPAVSGDPNQDTTELCIEEDSESSLCLGNDELSQRATKRRRVEALSQGNSLPIGTQLRTALALDQEIQEIQNKSTNSPARAAKNSADSEDKELLQDMQLLFEEARGLTRQNKNAVPLWTKAVQLAEQARVPERSDMPLSREYLVRVYHCLGVAAGRASPMDLASMRKYAQKALALSSTSRRVLELNSHLARAECDWPRAVHFMRLVVCALEKSEDTAALAKARVKLRQLEDEERRKVRVAVKNNNQNNNNNSSSNNRNNQNNNRNNNNRNNNDVGNDSGHVDDSMHDDSDDMPALEPETAPVGSSDAADGAPTSTGNPPHPESMLLELGNEDHDSEFEEILG
ncbi:MAG: hypothetical protein MHM6MM_003862 [Cercozoa sp. M6MM]